MAPESRKRRTKTNKQSKSRPPSGKGRALEELIARLEAAASGGQAEVKSPEFFIGRESGVKREVDVTVRSTVGSTTVLVMFECRDRTSTNDVRWIDEIAGKRDDIGADVASQLQQVAASLREPRGPPPRGALTSGRLMRSPLKTSSLGASSRASGSSSSKHGHPTLKLRCSRTRRR